MTQEELNRFNRGNELSDDIQKLELKIQSLVDFSLLKEKYPRIERGWELSATVNDNLVKIILESEEFWKCIEVVLNSKRDQLSELKKKFAEL